jgi:hypothetical protein
MLLHCIAGRLRTLDLAAVAETLIEGPCCMEDGDLER